MPDGKLTIQEDVIFMAPFNKMVNEDILNPSMGRFKVNDFISTTPLLDVTLGEASGGRASGTITVNQGSGSPVGSLDTYTVALDGEQISVNVSPDQTPSEVAAEIANAINTQSANYSATVDGPDITITSDANGTVYNGTIESTPGNTGITTNDTELTGGVDDESSAKANGTLTITSGADESKMGSKATVSGGVTRQGSTGGESYDINITFDGFTVPTFTVQSSDPASVIAAAITNQLNNHADIGQLWDFTYNGTDTNATFTGTAKQTGTARNDKILSISSVPSDASLPGGTEYSIQTSGGTSSGGAASTIDNYIVTLDGEQITVDLGTDGSINAVAQAVSDAINAQSTNYTATVTTDTVTITAINTGTVHNGTIETTPGNTTIASTDTELTGGKDGLPGSPASGVLTILTGTNSIYGQASATITVRDSAQNAPGPYDIRVSFYGQTLFSGDPMDGGGFAPDTPTSTIAHTIKDMLQSDPVISADWDVDIIEDVSNEFYTITITSKAGGVEWNGYDSSVVLVEDGTGGVFLGEAIINAGTTADGQEPVLSDLVLYLNGEEIIVDIAENQSAGTIAQAITDAINNQSVDYEATLNGTVITVTATKITDDYNGEIVDDPGNTGVDLTDTDLTGGNTTSGEGLDPEVSYWYAVRYVYADGHKTKTCFPQMVRTTSLQTIVELSILTDTDLFGDPAEIEIFRRTGEGNFLKIDRITPDVVPGAQVIYNDDGQLPMTGLDPQQYVWDLTFKTAEAVKDRYVRANLSFPEQDYSVPQITVTPIDIGDSEDGAVFNSKLDIMVRPRFTNGLEGYFSPVGSVEFNSGKFPDGEGSNYGVEIDQPKFADDIKELAYYGKYHIQGLGSGGSISLNTIEIYNQNLPSIETFDQAEADQDKPADPHLFLGWRYITRFAERDKKTAYHVVVDEDWAVNPDLDIPHFKKDSFYLEHVPLAEKVTLDNKDSNTLPFQITVNVLGRKLVYFKVADSFVADDNFVSNNDNAYNFFAGVYELGYFAGLKSAAELGALTVRLDKSPNNKPLSSQRSNIEYEQVEVPVSSIIDTSEEEFRLENATYGTWTSSPASSRVYAVLDAESIWKDVDNKSLNRNDASFDYDSKVSHYKIYPIEENPLDFSGDYQCSLQFNNVKPFEPPPLQPETSTVVDNPDGEGEYTIYTHTWKFTVVNRNIALEGEQLIFLGALKNENLLNQRMDTLGYHKQDDEDTLFYELNDYNIYATPVLKEDLDSFSDHIPYMISWSEPSIRGTNVFGLRTFVTNNFKVIKQSYGEILDIREHLNALWVFCERGVNKINIGEVLTHQGSGQVYVASSQFLTSGRWILKKLPGMHPDSIKQYNQQLFWCDGEDVWVITDGPKNITNGAIDLGDGPFIGAIDPNNKEYRISDGTQTWAYSIESGEWNGPFTYVETGSSDYKKQMFGIDNGHLVEHNQGFTFGGTAYNTIIESVAMDMQNPAMDKLWRKLLITADQVPDVEAEWMILDVEYGKQYEALVSKNLFQQGYRNGQFHVGIVPSEQNAPKLIWRIRTNLDNFVLRHLGYTFKTRYRP